MKIADFLKAIQSVPYRDRTPVISDNDLKNLINQYEMLYSDIMRLTTERDEAVNCIYGVQTALANGDSVGAMEEVVTYNFKLNTM